MTIPPIKSISSTIKKLTLNTKTSASFQKNTNALLCDSFEKSKSATTLSNKTINLLSKTFDDKFISFNFTIFQKNGIPLKYPREKFIEKIKKILKNIDPNKKAVFLNKFNLKLGINDIDGIPIIKEPITQDINEIKMIKLINKFYKNKTTSSNKKLNKITNAILKDFPEFAMLTGKKQHDKHIYSMDIHTLEVLSKSLKNPLYQSLSDEGKKILKLSVLMHDYGKNGNIITHNHPNLSKTTAEKILKKHSLSPDTEKRILNHIANHHWFAAYNLGQTNIEHFNKIFPSQEDKTIAVIMAKSDFESINNTFHLEKLTNKPLTIKQYERKINAIMAKLLNQTN